MSKEGFYFCAMLGSAIGVIGALYLIHRGYDLDWLFAQFDRMLGRRKP
jgi:hypothetical protein